MSSIVRSRFVRTKLTPTTVLRASLVLEAEVVGVLRHRLHVGIDDVRTEARDAVILVGVRLAVPQVAAGQVGAAQLRRDPGSSRLTIARRPDVAAEGAARQLVLRPVVVATVRAGDLRRGRRRTGCRRTRGAARSSRPSRSGCRPAGCPGGTTGCPRSRSARRGSASAGSRPSSCPARRGSGCWRRSRRSCRCRRSCSSRRCRGPRPRPGRR